MGKPPNHHVPYRNSMLTSVLRGSLGGNCKSVFIGTLNPEAEFVDESISTSIAQVAVDVHVNEEVDVYVLAELLQTENKRLQRDLAVTQAALKDQADVNSKLQAQVHPGVAMELHGTDHIIYDILAKRTQHDPASDKAECDQLVEKFLVAEWESPAQAQVAMEIERLGLGHAMYCLKSVKESLVFASNATVEVQEQLNIQNDRIAGMESRLAAQRAEAETLNRAMAALAAEVDEGDNIDRNKSKCAEWTEALQYLIKVKGAKPKQ
ncbi:hypothetical protein DYB32_007771 [Aphanomyces invadans]|uniref:Kinesin motor domain-containing protein n=1 Tax=Aphanomyces invadans TaxID=157072 RepID=A0A3R7A666_9STRA|nr:hypothetical protein DYB32_007771 [Aphanomyces invadans]